MAQYLILVYGDEAAEAAMSPEQWNGLLRDTTPSARQSSTRAAASSAAGPCSRARPRRRARHLGRRCGRAANRRPILTVKGQFGGYYHLEVPDLDVALDLARRCPRPPAGSSCVRSWR